MYIYLGLKEGFHHNQKVTFFQAFLDFQVLHWRLHKQRSDDFFRVCQKRPDSESAS